MSRVEIPYSGRIGVVCDECRQHDECGVTVKACDWCGYDVCSDCHSDHARECHEEGCRCETCLERRVCAAESLRDYMEDR